MNFDVESLLVPIEGANPSGRDLRSAGEEAILYYRLKEARFSARARERQADAEAEAAVQPPEWRALFDGVQSLLRTKSKDLEVATWLIEASLRLHGFAGLDFGFRVLDGLIERYWDTLHSIDTETVADKVAPVAGLNGIDGEGALIQPIRLTPLAAGSDEQAGLWVWQQAQRGGADSKPAKLLAAAIQSTSRDRFAADSRDLQAAWTGFGRLSARLDAVCGDEAPPLSTIRNVLEEAREALRQMSGIDPAVEAREAEEAALRAEAALASVEPGMEAAALGPPRVPEVRVMETRDDALRELGRIATFFREKEPHSPISYALETLIRRARLPLADLLRELIPDEAVRRSALNMAGITLDSTPGG